MKKVLAAGGIVLNQHNELLVIFRRLKWDLPKGHVGKKETFEACAIRETKEETGLKIIQVVKFIGVTEHIYYDNVLKSDVVKETHWFEMKADKKEPLHPQSEESIERVLWVSKNEIQKYLYNSYDNIRAIVKKCSLYG